MFELLDITQLLLKLASIAAILLVTFFLAKFSGAALRRALKPTPPLVADQIIRGVVVFIWVVGLLLAVNQLGLNLDILLVLLILAGIAVVVASRDLLSNVAARYLLGVYIPIKAGDFIEISGISGKVVEVNHVATILIKDDDSVAIVPNSHFVKEISINKTSIASLRLTIPVSIPARIDLAKAETELLKLTYKYRHHFDTRFPPVFTVRNRGETSLNGELDLILAKPELRETLSMELASKIKEVLERLADKEKSQ